jgi:hypothetical protein
MKRPPSIAASGLIVAALISIGCGRSSADGDRTASGAGGGVVGPAGAGGSTAGGIGTGGFAIENLGAARGLPSVSTACSDGNADPIARALCQSPRPAIRGLADLYRVLGLETFVEERLTAATTHSVGLAGRLVSALNPRVFVFSSYARNHALDVDNIAALAFTRGEQAVELVGYDPTAGDFNFYLLVFDQACNSARCTPADLFGATIEDGWASWTFYADHDLEDTRFDCLSCHRPDGAGAPKRLLMRQLHDPWMHWSNFARFNPAFLCSGSALPPGSAEPPSVEIRGDDLRLVEQVGTDGAAALYARVPFAELSSAASGHDFSSFVVLAAQAIESAHPEAYLRRAEPMLFDSRRILCEGSIGRMDTWREYRSNLLARGVPVPYHALDVLDPQQRSDAVADFFGYLGRRSSDDAFQIAASLMSDGTEEAVGFVPSPSDDAPTILRQMCIRCHDGATDTRLRRARFNAEKLDDVGAEAAAVIWKRLTAPRSAPDLMPPLHAGELPPWAIERIAAFLRLR